MTNSKTVNPDRSVVELRSDQWDLIVMALDRVRLMIGDPESMTYPVDRLCRSFTRRRAVETIDHIKAQVPEAGA